MRFPTLAAVAAVFAFLVPAAEACHGGAAARAAARGARAGMFHRIRSKTSTVSVMVTPQFSCVPPTVVVPQFVVPKPMAPVKPPVAPVAPTAPKAAYAVPVAPTVVYFAAAPSSAGTTFVRQRTRFSGFTSGGCPGGCPAR